MQQSNLNMLRIIKLYVPDKMIDIDSVDSLKCLSEQVQDRILEIEKNFNTEIVQEAYDKLAKSDMTTDDIREFLSIDLLPIPQRTKRALKRHNVYTVGDLMCRIKAGSLRHDLLYTANNLVKFGFCQNQKFSIIDDVNLGEECPKLYAFLNLKAGAKTLNLDILTYHGKTEDELAHSNKGVGVKKANLIFDAFKSLGYVRNNTTVFLPIYQCGPYHRIYFDVDKIKDKVKDMNLPSFHEFTTTSITKLKEKYKI